MLNEENPTQLQTLPSTHVTVVHTKNDAVTLIDSRTEKTGTVTLAVTEAMKLQKLLSMPGDPIPNYRGKKQFFLATELPKSADYSPHPVVEAGETRVVVTGQNGADVTLQPTDQEALCEALDSWGLALGGDGDRRSVLSLPAMIQLDDGISEPLLHAEYDEVLEHFHSAVGYWSPEDGAYVVEH